MQKTILTSTIAALFDGGNFLGFPASLWSLRKDFGHLNATNLFIKSCTKFVITL